MAKIRTRKDERNRMAELLGSDPYDGGDLDKYLDKTADAALSLAYELFLERDWFTVAQRFGNSALLSGLYVSENGALSAAQDLGYSGELGVFRIDSPSKRKAAVADTDSEGPTPKCVCGHPEITHNWPKYRHSGCVLKRCNCKKFTQDEGK